MSIATDQQPSHSSVLHASLGASPPNIVSAAGNFLYTQDGISLLDASGGAAVSCIGHGHPAVKRAITEQLDRVEYCFSPWFTTNAYENLAKALTDSTGGVMEKVFVVGSGAEAVEAALKMARQYYVELEGPQTQRTHFIARDRSYHGMRDNESEEQYVQRLAQELENEFQRVGPEKVCGFVAETVAGLTLGGVPPVSGYLKAMKEVCERHGALFILDEVFAGMGRTGTIHAWEQEDVVPDLQTVAKGLGAGYQAVGALLVSGKVVDVLSKGTKVFMHFQTYHGHPIACAAAYAVQQVVKEENLVENCRKVGSYLGELLQKRLGSHRNVGDIRGRGLVWGIELVKDRSTKEPFAASDQIAPTIQQVGLQREFSISFIPGGGVADGTNGDLIVISPAYNVTKQDVDRIVDRTARAIERVLGGEKDSKL